MNRHQPFPTPDASPRYRVLAGLEVLSFVLVGIAIMVMPFWLPPLMEVGFRDFVVTQGARDLLLVTLIYYLLRRGGEGLRTIGWHRHNGRREVLIGIWLFLPFYLGVAILEHALVGSGVPSVERPPAYLLPQGAGDYLLAVLFLVVVAVAEETIFRGYLLQRLATVFHSRAVAAVVSSLLFSVGHLYQGLAGVIVVWAIGMFLCWLAIRRGSLVAPSVIHFLQNFSGVVLLPLLFPEAFEAG